MVRELQFARRREQDVPPEVGLPWQPSPAIETHSDSAREHRMVAKDGRIMCSRIVEGESEVSPNVCRDCPFKAVNCRHLRFSLRQASPVPLIVRYNGRTEVWDDEPPEVRFEQAACAAKVRPIGHPRQCAGCTLRQPLQPVAEKPIKRGRRPAPHGGSVVPFPRREPALAALATDPLVRDPAVVEPMLGELLEANVAFRAR